MASSNVSKLILGFVLLILGVVFISQIATIGQGVTTLTQVTTNETVDISGVRGLAGGSHGDLTGQKVYLVNAYENDSWQAESSDCTITIVDYFINSTNRMTLNTDYSVDGDGGITIINTTLTADGNAWNDTIVKGYSYCPVDYVNLSWGRTGINLVPGFFGLALLLISIGIFYSIAKENGIV